MKSSLGRGFDSLIPDELFDEEFDPTAAEDGEISTLTELEITAVIRDEDQPRREFDEAALNALAASIKEQGILQPIVVTKEDSGKYKIVAGERRWRASQIAGLKKIPAIIRSLTDQNRLELSIIENAQREDLNAIELATAYNKLKAEFNLTAKDIAERVGKSEASIAATIRLLTLPDSAKKAMVEHKLTEGVMRPLIAAGPETIDKILPKIIEEGWTARQVERYLSENKQKSSTKAIKASANIKEENKLIEKYSAKAVKIKGRGVSFSFKTEKDLQNFLKKI